jgi:hypothetical protein
MNHSTLPMTYTLGIFPVVHGTYDGARAISRASRIILEICNALAESIRNDHAYQTRLHPPSADPRCCHPTKKETLCKP